MPFHPKAITIIANWKMSLDIRQSVRLAGKFLDGLARSPRNPLIRIIVCPSYDALAAVHDIFAKSDIMVGAQDVFWKERGAYTGEVSASMLKAAGASFVIIGHSERRKYLHEVDVVINRKVHAALAEGLVPILCVGETYEERFAGNTDLILMTQVIEGLKGIPLRGTERIIIAYEPVWVIGSGSAIEPAMVEHAANVIQQSLIDLFPPEAIDRQTRVIYGGSVNEGNIDGFAKLPMMSGALVGSASLSDEKFINLIKAIS